MFNTSFTDGFSDLISFAAWKVTTGVTIPHADPRLPAGGLLRDLEPKPRICHEFFRIEVHYSSFEVLLADNRNGPIFAS